MPDTYIKRVQDGKVHLSNQTQIAASPEAQILWLILQEMKSIREGMQEVPVSEQKASPSEAAPVESTGHATNVSLNSATKTRLESLPKVGAATSKKIIDARPLASLEQARELLGEDIWQEVQYLVEL